MSKTEKTQEHDFYVRIDEDLSSEIFTQIKFEDYCKLSHSVSGLFRICKFVSKQLAEHQPVEQTEQLILHDVNNLLEIGLQLIPELGLNEYETFRSAIKEINGHE